MKPAHLSQEWLPELVRRPPFEYRQILLVEHPYPRVGMVLKAKFLPDHHDHPDRCDRDLRRPE